MLLILLLFFASTRALPQGAPTSVCESMLPNHGGGIPPQSGISPYTVIPRRQNGAVLVTIQSGLGIPFQGFMLQGRTPEGDILGEFDVSSTEDGHSIDCSNTGDALTHKSPNSKASLDVVWNPPDGYEGPVIFNATIAQGYDTFWVGVESPQVEISKRSPDDAPPLSSTRRPKTTTPPYFTPQADKESSAEFDQFYDGCAVTKLCFGAPTNCINSKNCKAVVAVTVLGDKYDFELKATSGAAWVGVGLSDDVKMGDDSVIECVKSGNGLKAFMSWTTVKPYAANRLSDPELGIQLLNSSISDDTIYCKVRREAVTNIRGRNFDLVNDKYNLLVAAGNTVTDTSVKFHGIAVLASGEKQFLSDVSALAAASKLLVRIHGSFMVLAWIGTASIGMLLARYYRQTWTGTSLCGKDLWFAWHRMFMVLTWALTMCGFVLIFLELRAWSAENNPHAILGTTTTILCFFQPIAAYFRPHPGTSKRPIFNWLHWFAGNVAHIIAIVTIFFAIRLTKAELPLWMDWILVAYVVVHVVFHLTLSLLGCLSDKRADTRINAFPMKDLNGSGRAPAYIEPPMDEKYSRTRRAILGVYIFLVLLLTIALIVITALAPIEDTWETVRKAVTRSS
ncbi:unnamed protein product [Brassicogethes aeneus]|uniref:Ferric-chelate reductase 1 homolog n=1 Tax=Brassicogethes aeneus TaxID=1431903 RepID=A0A9P0AY75_BRAAE|nr:unnamed protein product [Brassicogethes aeneus]